MRGTFVIGAAELARAALRDAGPNVFAERMLAIFDMPVVDYMRELARYRPAAPMDPPFRHALRRALDRSGLSDADAAHALAGLEHGRTLQTSGHLTLSNGPGFFGVDWLSTLAATGPDTPCVIGVFSCVPFNNDAKSGCLNFGDRYGLRDVIDARCPAWRELARADRDRRHGTRERRVSLVPTRLVRRLVFGARVPDRTHEVLPYLSEPLQRIVPPARPDDMSALATTMCARLESAIFGRPMVFVDLCELVSDYLQTVLLDDAHPMARLCFDAALNTRLRQALPQVSWFSFAGPDGDRCEQLRVDGARLTGRGFDLGWEPASVAAALRDRVLCPGLFPVFASIAFVNQFQCFGSFNQVQYLTQMKRVLSQLRGFDGDSIAAIPTDALTLGSVRNDDGAEVHPIDVLLGSPIEWNPHRSVGDFASTVILKRRWQRNGFADAGGGPLHAFVAALQG